MNRSPISVLTVFAATLWGATDYPEFLAHWNTNFFGWNAANFGWGADQIENMLWRVENGELDGVQVREKAS